MENLYPQGSEKGHRGGDQHQAGGKGRFQKRRWGHLADGEDSDEDEYEDYEGLMAQQNDEWQEYVEEQVNEATRATRTQRPTAARANGMTTTATSRRT